MRRFDILWIAIAIVLDQMSKMIVESFMELYDSITLIPNFFKITYVRNTGAAFSMLEGKMIFFYIISIVALVLMFYYLIKADKKNYLMRSALILMIAGTIGNFIDRLAFQFVRDFLDFTIFGYDFAIFNVADSFLVIGVIILIIEAFIADRKE